jgi:beta-N-acetylhexosaminidase
MPSRRRPRADGVRFPPLTLEQALGQRFLLSFDGRREPPPDVLDALRRQQVGGIVLFRFRNMGTLEELRGLTAALQRAAADTRQPPLLIAADQEGGQLMAVGDATPFPGNLALGAARSETLARRVGCALGRELAALGINVDFAPVADVNNNPGNPVVGTRSFGEDPRLVARLVAALVRGIQSAGVAATAKHFPGHGDTGTDSHHGAPVLEVPAERFRRVELPPFRAAVRSGVRLVMTAHIVVPALNGGGDTPATLSAPILRGLLRRRLGFRGVVVSDALDMGAIDQGPGLAMDCAAALSAGVDLLLLNHAPAIRDQVCAALAHAARRGLLAPTDVRTAAARVLALKRWLAGREQPPLAAVRCREHVALAREVARRSMTLVRDAAGLLPLRLPATARVAVIVPRPEDLTPADTSSTVVPALAAAVRRHHPIVEEHVVPMNPSDAEVRALREQVAGLDLAIVGTINADRHPGQAALVTSLVSAGTPTVAVALRMPYDLGAYPSAPTYACAYSILSPSMEAMADALWGLAPFPGRLPVSLPRGLGSPAPAQSRRRGKRQ